jgi:hypothetical protein
LPDERRFYQAILAQVFAPFRPSKTAGNLQFEVVQLLSTVGVKMLIIDEIASYRGSKSQTGFSVCRDILSKSILQSLYAM